MCLTAAGQEVMQSLNLFDAWIFELPLLKFVQPVEIDPGLRANFLKRSIPTIEKFARVV